MAKLFITTSLFAHASASSLISSFISTPSADRCRNQMNSPSVIRPSITRHIHKLNLTYNSSNDVSMLSLSQLLDLLHQNNIRYAPSASREQLEDLLQTHLMNSANQRTPFGSSRSKTRNKIASIDGKNDAIVNGVNDIVDAVVLPEQTHHETNERYKGRRRYQHTNQTQNKRPRRRKESYNNYHQQEARHSRYRQKKQNYDSNDNIIDAVFDLPDMPSTDATYENGLQIFLMGFAEAGKTAAELAVDAAKKTIHLPFSDDAEYDGYDVDHIQRYWDSELNRRPKRRTGRRRRQFSSNESRMDQRETQSLVPSRRNVQSYDDSTLAGFESTQVQQRLPNRPRHSKNDDGQPKPIYGLEYVHDNERAKNEDMIPRQYRQLSHHKQQWKDRLRKKFDAALGIEPTTSSIEKESYYDSWKRNMREMDDTHKDRVRWKITDKVNTTPEVPNHTQTRMTATRVPQNRRARMTAAKAKIPNEPALPDSIQVAAAQKTRATKFESKLRSADRPFWKERGSIASLLFDNNSSSWKRDIQKKNKRTLEQLLLSPAGRERTITSLILYIARSSFSLFGNLCRWAGVRGTIPQPIVVVTVCAVILSSYRQQKLLSLGLTLLAIRMLGEFIHGSVHGNEFWDDEYNQEMHEWVAED